MAPEQLPQGWAEGESLEQVYDEKIAPLMSQIIEVCKEHELPVVASFQFGPESFCTTALSFDRMHDRLRGCAQLIRQGFLAFHTIRRQEGRDTQ